MRSNRSASPANARTRSRSRSVARNSNMRTHDENGNMIDDAAVSIFISGVDALPTDEWRARTLAFESLIESLPKINDPQVFTSSGITPWYKSHTTLRRLFKPLSDLLLDPRSTVAKHICQHLSFLVRRIKDLNPPNSDTCKYLLKDLLPTFLSLHAQTVKLIRGYAVEMMNIIIPLCRFKSGLPVLLERLRKDKSRDVREACVKYLRLVVCHWSRDTDLSSSEEGEESSGHENQAKPPQQDYLTPSICLHIGNGLARALMDPSQSVRMDARNAFEIFRYKYPDIWNQIVQKKDGILSKDKRLKKSIINAAIKSDAEGRSDLGNYFPSYEEGEDYDGKSVHSGGSKESWRSKESFASKISHRGGFRDVNPKRSSSRQRSSSRHRSSSRQRSSSRPRNSNRQGSRSTSGLSGPPKRTVVGGGSHLPPSRMIGITNGRAVPQAVSKAKPVPQRSTEHTELPHSPPNLRHNDPIDHNTVSPPIISEVIIKNTTSDHNDTGDESRNPSSAVENEIPATTSSVSDDQSSANDVGDSQKPNENCKVASQLLSAHKTYIDELMESLRLEMNTVREFEELLTQSKSSIAADGTYGPSVDDVTNYFETVYNFLERGTENGTKLREAMERVTSELQ